MDGRQPQIQHPGQHHQIASVRRTPRLSGDKETDMDTLSTAEWAPIERETDPDVWLSCFDGPFSAVSSDTAVATIGQGTAGVLAAVGQAAGEFDYTVTRLSDGATGTGHGTVTAVNPGPGPGTFVVRLGSPQPKG
jgi:hypothetical protein